VVVVPDLAVRHRRARQVVGSRESWLPEPLKENSGKNCYETELTLAILPYAEFDCYWQPEGGGGLGTSLNREGDERYRVHEKWSFLDFVCAAIIDRRSFPSFGRTARWS
jgi:hypothetical protein